MQSLQSRQTNHRISPERCAALVQRLLAPDETKRLMADQLLASLYFHDALDGDISREAFGFIKNPGIFVPALVSYWARSALEGHNRWMASCGMESFRPAAPAWRSPHEAAFPFAPCGEKPAFGLFLGISQWLEKGPGPDGALLALPQLIACLEHPVCGDAAVAILAGMGRAARPALPAFLEHIRKNDGAVRLFGIGRAMADLIDDDAVLAENMARGLSPASSLRVVEVYCGVFDRLRIPVPGVVDMLLALQECEPVRNRPEWILALLPCAARLAGKADYRIADIRRLVLHHARHTETFVREAVAFALGEAFAPDTDEPLLIELSRDNEWLVRHAAHQAAAGAENPPPELVRATAEDLGNYDGYDGSPHDEALTALIRWGAKLAPAGDAIVRWLESEDMDVCELDSSKLNRLADLLDSLGAIAQQALPALRRLHESLTQEVGEAPDDEDGEAISENVPGEDGGNARFTEFAAELGIDIGALSVESLPAEEDAAARLSAILERLSAEEGRA